MQENSQKQLSSVKIQTEDPAPDPFPLLSDLDRKNDSKNINPMQKEKDGFLAYSHSQPSLYSELLENKPGCLVSKTVQSKLKTINSYYFQINDSLEESSTPSVNDHPDRQI